jgi:hypothetical protein
VGHDVVHLACDARALRGRAESTLLVALEFQPRGLLLQGGQQSSALTDRDAEHARSGGQPGEPNPYLQRLRRRPAHRRDDGPELHRAGGEHALDQAPVQGHLVQGEQQRDIRQLRAGEQPLRQGDEGDQPKAQERSAAAQQQRRAQRPAEAHGDRVETVLGRQTADAQRRCGEADREVDRERMTGAQPGQPPRPLSQPRRRQLFYRVIHASILAVRHETIADIDSIASIACRYSISGPRTSRGLDRCADAACGAPWMSGFLTAT